MLEPLSTVLGAGFRRASLPHSLVKIHQSIFIAAGVLPLPHVLLLDTEAAPGCSLVPSQGCF